MYSIKTIQSDFGNEEQNVHWNLGTMVLNLLLTLISAALNTNWATEPSKIVTIHAVMNVKTLCTCQHFMIQKERTKM